MSDYARALWPEREPPRPTSTNRYHLLSPCQGRDVYAVIHGETGRPVGIFHGRRLYEAAILPDLVLAAADFPHLPDFTVQLAELRELANPVQKKE